MHVQNDRVDARTQLRLKGAKGRYIRLGRVTLQALVIWAFGGAVSVLPGQEPILLERKDGTIVSGHAFEWTKEGQVRLLGPTPPLELPPNDVANLTFGSQKIARPLAGVLLQLRNGDRLFGTLEEGNFDEVVVATVGLGVVRILIDSLSAVVFLSGDGRSPTLPGLSGGEDELFLVAAGKLDRLPGELLKVGRGAVVFTSAAGVERRFGTVTEGVAAVRLASQSGGFPRGSVSCTFRDGTRLSGELLEPDEAGVRLRLAAGPVANLDRRALLSVEFRASGVTPLGDLLPLTYVHEPFFPEAHPELWLPDENGRGREITIGTKSWRRGLALPLGGRITYAVPPEAKHFTAELGLPPAVSLRGGQGSARLRVLVDGRVAHETRLLLVGDEATPLRLELGEGARELTVQADGVDLLGTQGRFLLAAACFR